MKTIVISGNIGKDAETRTTQGGDSVTSFNVAVEERAGQEKRTIWFSCSLWGKRGQSLAPYLTKGGKVSVAGDFSTREHDGKTYLTIRADQVTLLGGKSDGGRDDAGQSSGYGAGGRPGGGFDDGDAIPFAAEVR